MNWSSNTTLSQTPKNITAPNT